MKNKKAIIIISCVVAAVLLGIGIYFAATHHRTDLPDNSGTSISETRDWVEDYDFSDDGDATSEKYETHTLPPYVVH